MEVVPSLFRFRGHVVGVYLEVVAGRLISRPADREAAVVYSAAEVPVVPVSLLVPALVPVPVVDEQAAAVRVLIFRDY